MTSRARFITLVLVLSVVQWVVFNIVLFIASLILRVPESEPPAAPAWLVVAVVMGLVAWLFARWMRLTDRRQIVTAGVAWSVISLLLMLLVTIANQTQGIIFGNWGVYPVFISPAIGTWLYKPKQSTGPAPFTKASP